MLIAKTIGRFRKQIRYLVAGGAAALLEYGSFILLVYVSSTAVLAAQVVSFLLGMILAFVLHATWTFSGNASKKMRKNQFIMYALLAGINIVLTSILIAVLFKIGVPAWLAKVLVMGAVVVWNFAILNKVIFGSKLEKGWSKKVILQKVKNNYEALILLALILVFGLSFVAITPLGAGHDEVSHVIKADATSRLDLFPEEVKFTDENNQPSTIYTHQVSPTLADYSGYAFNIRNEDRTPDVVEQLKHKGAQPYNVKVSEVDAWGAAGYNGIAYIPNATGMKLARHLQSSVVNTMYLSKITSVITYATVIVWAFFIVRMYKIRYMVFFASLFPPITASFAAISSDGFLNAMAILLVALVARSLLDKKMIPDYLRIIALLVAVILPLAKLPYLILSLIVLWTPIVGIRHKKLIVPIFLMILLGVNFGWNHAVSGANTLQSERVSCCGSPAVPAEQINHVLNNPIESTGVILSSVLKLNVIDEVGRVAQQLEPRNILNRDLIALYLGVLFMVMLFYKDEAMSIYKNHKKTFYVVFGAVLVTFFGILGALYVAASSVGQSYIWGVQARYFLPLLAPLLLVLPVIFSWIVAQKVPKKIIKITIIVAVLVHLLSLLTYLDVVKGVVSW